MRAQALNSSFINGLDWNQDLSDIRSFDSRRMSLQLTKCYDETEGTMENWDPHSLPAKSNSADTPNWNEAMNGPNAQGFWEACRKEVKTLARTQDLLRVAHALTLRKILC